MLRRRNWTENVELLPYLLLKFSETKAMKGFAVDTGVLVVVLYACYMEQCHSSKYMSELQINHKAKYTLKMTSVKTSRKFTYGLLKGSFKTFIHP